MDLGKGFDSSKYGDITHGEVVYVIKLSAMLCSVDEIQAKFRGFTNGTKNIRGEVVQEIQADFAKRIQREADAYLKYVDGNPFAHPRLVLDMYLEIYTDARIPRPTQTFKLGPDDWRVSEEPDNKTALNAIDSATKYLREGEKVTLEKLKRNQSLFPTTPPKEEDPATVEEEQPSTTWKME